MPSGRRSSRRPWYQPHSELDLGRALGGRRSESGPDGDWVVQSVGAAAATKTYRCPGCRQDIPPGTAHVVAWSTDSLLGAEVALSDRRHWHTSCWSSRTARR